MVSDCFTHDIRRDAPLMDQARESLAKAEGHAAMAEASERGGMSGSFERDRQMRWLLTGNLQVALAAVDEARSTTHSKWRRLRDKIRRALS
jgi:hypothetical protein